MNSPVILVVLTLAAVSCGQPPPEPQSPPPESVRRPSPEPEPHRQPVPSFAEWRDACLALPTNRQLGGRIPGRDLLPLKGAEEFDRVLDAAFEHFRNGPLSLEALWIGKQPDFDTFLDPARVYYRDHEVPFSPFAARLEVPAGSRFWIHGDFHGDIRSLISFLDSLQGEGTLDGFRIVPEDLHFLFLGDYTDRGSYGVEVIYTLLRLLLANPENVFLVRGNHEDISLTAGYGFVRELGSKFGAQYDEGRPMRLYDYLPVVLYLGCGDHYVQCNHGGMEPGYDPVRLLASEGTTGFQLLGIIDPGEFALRFGHLVEPARHLLVPHRPQSPVDPTTLGFMWNDFTLLPEQPALGFDPGRAWIHGKAATEHILEGASRGDRQLIGVLRAHQHSSIPDPMMRRLIAGGGIHRHWQEGDGRHLLIASPRDLAPELETERIRHLPPGCVYTFNVSPDSVYGRGCDYGFDAWGLLTLDADYADWSLEVRNPVIIPNSSP